MKFKTCSGLLWLGLVASSSAFLVPPDVNFEDIQGLPALEWVTAFPTHTEAHPQTWKSTYMEAHSAGTDMWALPCPGCSIPRKTEDGRIEYVDDIDNLIYLNFTYSEGIDFLKLNDVSILSSRGNKSILVSSQPIPVQQAAASRDEARYEVPQKYWSTLEWSMGWIYNETLCNSTDSWTVFGMYGTPATITGATSIRLTTDRFLLMWLQKSDSEVINFPPGAQAVHRFGKGALKDEIDSFTMSKIADFIQSYSSSYCAQGEQATAEKLSLIHPSHRPHQVLCPTGLFGLRCRMNSILQTLFNHNGGASFFSSLHIRPPLPPPPPHRRPCHGMKTIFENRLHLHGGPDKFRRPTYGHGFSGPPIGLRRQSFVASFFARVHYATHGILHIVHELLFNYLVPIALGICAGILAVSAGFGIIVGVVAVLSFFKFFILHLYFGKEEFERRFVNEDASFEESEGLNETAEKEAEAMRDVVKDDEALPEYVEKE